MIQSKPCNKLFSAGSASLKSQETNQDECCAIKDWYHMYDLTLKLKSNVNAGLGDSFYDHFVMGSVCLSCRCKLDFLSVGRIVVQYDKTQNWYFFNFLWFNCLDK